MNSSYIPRDEYLNWLEEFRDKKLIKVLTGIRRCGKSTILEMFGESLVAKGIPRGRILTINFEEFENEPYLEPHKLHDRIMSAVVPGEKLYVFLDEIQQVKEYEKVLDSLYVKKDLDLYVTGSTADLLSSEIATRLTGRYVEINVLPLSFKESLFGKKPSEGNLRKLFMDYITYGGLPGAREYVDGSSAQREYVMNVFKTILEKDVLKSSKRGRFLVERIIRYMTDTVGSLTSPKRLTDRLKEEQKTPDEKAAAYNTVVSYLERLTDCFFFYRPERYDVVGGELLQLVHKYYLTDFGFKHYLFSNVKLELQQLIENVVYFELIRRRYQVTTGKVADKEVDFRVKGYDGSIFYVQVAVTVASEEKLKQELDAFKSIDDNYPKYILTLDDIFTPDHSGVKTINLIDFLLGKSKIYESLEEGEEDIAEGREYDAFEMLDRVSGGVCV